MPWKAGFVPSGDESPCRSFGGRCGRGGGVAYPANSLGVERETVERGAKLAGQGAWPCVSPVSEGPEARLAALRQHAAALDRGGIG